MNHREPHQRYTESPTMVFGNYFANACLVIGFFILLYIHTDKFIYVWRFLRIFEFYLYSSIETFLSLFGINSSKFTFGLNQLLNTSHTKINMAYISNFEVYYNTVLRWLYGVVVIGFGIRMYFNQRKVISKHNVISLMKLYGRENEALQTLIDDDPTLHPIRYDFSNRDDYHNRHSQALSASQYIQACPPPNSSSSELDSHEDFLKNNELSKFRPIAIFSNQNTELDFSEAEARMSLERQLTKPPVENPFYSDPDFAPRLFDTNGEIVPFILDKKKNAIDGFSIGGLINNGNPYKGSAAQIPLLFNGFEREVFDFLVERFNHPSVSIDQVALSLLDQHAYTRTYLIELLEVVRLNANAASTEFYLLCRKDRGLYMSLYSVGEELPFYEALGVINHWKMEKLVGTKVIKPSVSQGVVALKKDAVRLSSFTPDSSNVVNQILHGLPSNSDIKDARVESYEIDASLLAKKEQVEFDL